MNEALNQYSNHHQSTIFSEKVIISKLYQDLWIERIKLARAINCNLSDLNKILFAQKLLDRLIFLYFLVEKGFVRREKNGATIKIETTHFFSLIASGTDFYGIFSEIINKHHSDESKSKFQIIEINDFQCSIPYLPEDIFAISDLNTLSGSKISEADVKIVGFNWSTLIEIFNQYNWSIEKRVSNDSSTVGIITPEILGYLYEKFVITITTMDKITFEELKKYNFTATGIFRKGTKSAGVYYTPDQITYYMAKQSIFARISQTMNYNDKYSDFNEFVQDNNMNEEILDEFTNHLLDLKILDPAVGSGAFLLVIAKTIFDWAVITSKITDKYTLRRKIVSNLYGIDIMPGAIEICKLRLWLWTIAPLDDDEVQPLSNLDFNLIRGNSLIGIIEGMGTIYNENINQHAYDLMKNDEEALNKKYFSYLQSQGYEKNFPEFKQEYPVHISYQFKEVFKEKNGFDIIIGNPPYYQIRKDESYVYTNSYAEVLESRLNIATVFVNRWLKILGPQSIMTMIVPKGFAYTGGWSKLRTKVLSEYELMSLVDCGKAFSGVKLEQMIFLLRNKTEFELERNKISIRKLEDGKIVRSHIIPQILCRDDDKLHLETDPLAYEIKKRMEKTAKRLSSLNIKIYRGLPNKYVATSKTMSITAGLKGRDISPFFIRSYSRLDVEAIQETSSRKIPSNNEIILLQRILAHISNHVKIVGVRNQDKLPTISTISNLEILNNEGISSKYLLGLLHSSLINFYVHKFIYCNAIRSMDLDRYYLEQIPLPISDNKSRSELIGLIDKIEKENKELDNYEQFQERIDNIVFKEFNLNSKEIKFVREYIIS